MSTRVDLRRPTSQVPHPGSYALWLPPFAACMLGAAARALRLF